MSRRGLLILGLLIVVVGIALVVYAGRRSGESPSTGTIPTPPPAGQSGAPPLGQRTKTSGCVVRGPLPDPDCSPGAVFPSATAADICKPGYSRSVRNVPTATKNAVYREYGISSRVPGEYEVDHIISLELGGSNEIANLFPEAAEPRPGFHEKDRYENYAHDQVCRGEIAIQEAQRRIASDWLKYWIEAGRP